MGSYFLRMYCQTGIAGWHGSSVLKFSEKPGFHSGCTDCSHTRSARGRPFSTSSPAFLSSVLANSHSVRHEELSHCGCAVCSPGAGAGASSPAPVVHPHVPRTFNWVIVFLLSSCVSALYILDITPSSEPFTVDPEQHGLDCVGPVTHRCSAMNDTVSPPFP